MDTRKVLYFLGILNRETNGYADEIAEIYKRALDENDDVILLKRLLNDYIYYGERGKTLYQNGTEILDRLYAAPSKSLEILPRLKQVQKSIEDEARACHGLMRSPLPFSAAVTVLRKKDTTAYMAALKMVAGTCVYLTALYEGLASLKGLIWYDAVGIQEMVYAVNTKFLPALCSVSRPSCSWVIRKGPMGGKALFGGDCFYLYYESTERIEALCGNLRKEPMGTHAFLNTDAYEFGENDVPFCWGTGNLLSVTPDHALQFLQNGVATRVRSPQGQELKRKMPSPIECIRQLTDGEMFCITPDELLLAMNQWQSGYEIESRIRTHNCLFCGKYVDGNQLVCSAHFTSEWR